VGALSFSTRAGVSFNFGIGSSYPWLPAEKNQVAKIP